MEPDLESFRFVVEELDLESDAKPAACCFVIH